MGDRDKYKNLIKGMNVPDNWLEKIDNNSEMLYRMSKTSEEVILKFSKR
jgi:hypothetical protein